MIAQWLSRWAEQWISELPVESGHEDGFGYSHNGEVLFGNIYLPEPELVDLERATLKLYVHIEQLLQRKGYPYCLRMWNFLAGINAGEGDHERYRLFSAGRARALALKPDFEQRLPAATAIGMSGPGLVVYFLAGPDPDVVASAKTGPRFLRTLPGLHEVLDGVTRNAARALGLESQIGTIALGKAADLAVWRIESPEELGYWIGLPGPERRIYGGVDA